MKRVLILFMLLIFAFSVSAFAEVMTNEAEGIVLTYGIGFGGSANDLEDAGQTIKLYDIKGQPVIGRNLHEGVFRWWGAGYHLWAVEEEVWTQPTPSATYELEDTGWIRNTQITLEGDNLKITWDYDPAKGPTAVLVHTYNGNGAEFDTTFVWGVAAPPHPAGDTEHIAYTAGTFPMNYYFRVVPDPLLPGTNPFSESNNSITVGKVNVFLPQNLWVFASLSFMEDNVSLKGLLTDQLGEGADFLWWNGSAYKGATYSIDDNGWNGTDGNLRVGEGFLLRAAASDKNVALTGRFGKFTQPCVLPLVQGQWALIGYPYPIAETVQGMGIISNDDDDLLEWNVFASQSDQQNFKSATYDGGVWSGFADIDSLELARPRFYRPVNALIDWTINLP